jgi:hypothetical protein
MAIFSPHSVQINVMVQIANKNIAGASFLISLMTAVRLYTVLQFGQTGFCGVEAVGDSTSPTTASLSAPWF